MHLPRGLPSQRMGTYHAMPRFTETLKILVLRAEPKTCFQATKLPRCPAKGLTLGLATSVAVFEAFQVAAEGLGAGSVLLRLNLE